MSDAGGEPAAQFPFALDEILASETRNGFRAKRYLPMLEPYREEVIPILRGVMRRKAGTAKLNASCLLIELGDAQGASGLMACLRRQGTQTGLDALMQLRTLSGDGQKIGPLPALLDSASIYRLIEPLLRSSHLGDGLITLQVLEGMDTEESRQRLEELYSGPDQALRVKFADWVARRARERGSLATIEELLFAPELDENSVYHAVHALAHFAAQEDSETRARAARAAIRYLHLCLEKNGPRTGDSISACMEAMRLVAPPEERAALTATLHSRIDPSLRISALLRLAELDGADSAQRLIGVLRNPELRRAALERLGSFVRNSADPEIVGALIGVLESEDGIENVKLIIDTVLAVGNAPAALMETLLPYAEPNQAMSLHWLLGNLRATDLVRRLTAAGIIAAPDSEALAEYEEQWLGNHNANGILYEIMGQGKRLAGFLCKTVTSPADYIELLQDFGAITGGTFVPKDITQTVEGAEEDEVKIAFVAGGRDFSFSVKHYGRHYDVEGAVKGLNDVLASIGREERFFVLEQTELGVVAFAPEQEFLEIAKEFHIPIT